MHTGVDEMRTKCTLFSLHIEAYSGYICSQKTNYEKTVCIHYCTCYVFYCFEF